MLPFPAPGLRERKDTQVKRALFEAAMELFREKGYDATSIDEVAAKAGYSRATFFNHFGTKRGVFRYYGQSLSERVGELLAEEDLVPSPLDRIRRILLAMAREADVRREDLKVVFFHSLTDPEYVLGPTEARTRISEVLTSLMREAQERDQARTDQSADTLAFHVLSLYHSAVFAQVWGLGDAEATMESAWQFLLTGVTGGNPLAE